MLVYVCSPFNGKNDKEVDQNIQKSIEYAKAIYRRGFTPIVPHLQSLITGKDIPRKEVFDHLLKILAKCDAMCVCGERISKGMKTEIMFCIKNGIKLSRLRRR